jgi:hypothetical protein
MTTAFYVFTRFLLGSLNLLGVWLFAHFRMFHLTNAIIAFIPIGFWIGALWVKEPYNIALQWMSFLFGSSSKYILAKIDWFPYYLVLFSMSVYGRIKNRPELVKYPLLHLVKYYPAVDMEARIERTSNFITMVFGYIVVNLLFQSNARIGFNGYNISNFYLTYK